MTERRIRNWDLLAVTDARKAALTIAEAALEAIDTGAAIRRAVALEGAELRVAGGSLALPPGGRLRLVAVGKCAHAAAAALADILGARLTDGIALDVSEAARVAIPRVRYLHGTHPLPSEVNAEATRAILRFLDGGRPGDVVLWVVSGGGSTLLCLPPPGGSVEAERTVVEALTRAGATIQEINTVRKHASLARGGLLAVAARPARMAGLIFSDVPGGASDLVASGPTLLDPTTVADAERVLARYGVPAGPGKDRLALIETPKDPADFALVRNTVVVSNAVALDAMAAAARRLGLAADVRTATLSGEARDAAASIVRDLDAAPAGTARLYGGETTVTGRGPGRGGRNLELALAALAAARDDELVLTLATDGRDNGDLAGAIADAATRESARRASADPADFLVTNDSYGFFARVPHALETGPTGANVADLIVALRG